MSSKSIVFVDSRVSNYQSLIDSLAEPFDVFVLDGDRDGLDQMAGYLKGRSALDAIHVISHGSQGALYLGSTVLESNSLATYGTQLGSIGSSLTQTGDILLYGCNVAQGDVGGQFVNAIAQATSVDVAASDDATGIASLGGDRVLEQVSGSVETASMPVNRLTGLLAANISPTFGGSTGKVITGFGTDANGQSVAIQADGKIVVAGNSDGNFALLRYNINGTLDTSFDGDGKLTTNFGSYSVCQSVAIQADGKIVVAGYAGGADNDFALARFTINGTLDTSFDGDGKITTAIGAGYDWGRSVTIQPNGKILVAGSSFTGKTSDFSVVRYNIDGSIDTTFGGNGKVTSSFDIGDDNGYSVTVQPDGKILVAGYSDVVSGSSSSRDFALVRYNNDGSFDTTFSNDGKVTTAFNGYGNSGLNASVVRQPDGKILVAGTNYNGSGWEFALVRYNNDGSLDTTFSGDGKVTTNIQYDGFCSGLTLQADGKILAVGYNRDVSNKLNFIVLRYNSNGTLDTTFDGDGQVIVHVGETDNSADTAYGISVQSNGRIVVVGNTTSGSSSDIALVRLNTDGSLDSAFGSSDVTGPDVAAPTIGAVTPADEATSVAVTSNIVLTFSEAIQRGSGNILLKTAAGVTVATFDAATSSNLTVAGNVLTINPSTDLSYSTGYKVEFAAGTIKDLTGNSYAGTTSYNFTTTNDPSNQTFIGTSANESFTGGTGNDTIGGGSGIDTAVFSGASTEYLVTYDSIISTYSVKDAVGSRDDTDKLTSVELLQFSDGLKELATTEARLVAGVYQALFGKAQGSTTFSESLAKIDPSASAYDWAKAEATVLSTLSDSAFSTLVLNNMSINNQSLTATSTFGTSQQAFDTLQQAVAYYLGAVGTASRGIVVAQLAEIIASFEGETVFGVYGPAATAFNRQVASNLAHSINTQNTSEVVAVPVFTTGSVSASGGDFEYMLAMGNYNYQITGFGSGDKIIGPTGVSAALVNDNTNDGVASVQYASGGQTVNITLTGLSTAQDGALHGATDLNTVFGPGAFV